MGVENVKAHITIYELYLTYDCYRYLLFLGITENFFIIVEQPLTVSVVDLVKCKFQNEPLIGAFKWFHDERVTNFIPTLNISIHNYFQAKLNVVCRKTGQLLNYFLADSFFYLHIINQYEIDDYVVVDICCYKDPTMLECMYIEAMKVLIC